MYKKTGNSTHYLPRKGSYSTHPHRNGRVDVLPPGASMPLYDAATQLADAIDRLNTIKFERDDIETQIQSLGRIDQLRDRFGSHGSEAARLADLSKRREQLDKETRTIKTRVADLKRLLGGGGKVAYEHVFVRLAEAELPEQTFRSLSRRARSIVDSTGQKRDR